MRQSSGQKMHWPGQPAGAVSTVTGATPLWVRMGFMRMRRSSSGSASTSPSATRWR